MTQLLAVTTIALLGAISPGPDFFIVIENAGLYHRKNGFMAALGVASALFIHQAYCILGLSWLLTTSPWAFHVIKLLGASYLIYIGINAIRFKAMPELMVAEDLVASRYPTLKKSFWQGFLCNALNPKAALFFIGLYSLVIDPLTSFFMKMIYALSIITVTFLWFVVLSALINIQKIKKGFIKYQTLFTKLFGVVIVAFGIKVLFL